VDRAWAHRARRRHARCRVDGRYAVDGPTMIAAILEAVA
jgi:hypothetical protein